MAQDLRSIPYSEEAEKAVLGAMLIDTNSIGTAILKLTEASFYIEKHRYIFTALNKIYNSHQTADFVSIISQLEKDGHIDQVTRDYIVELGNFVPSSANIDYYIKIVHEKALYRQLINIGNELIQKSYEQGTEASELIESLDSTMINLANKLTDANQLKSLYEITIKLLDKYEQRKNSGLIAGVSSGFSDIDKLTNGWQNTDLIVVAGRPSMGKTAFALNLGFNAALDFLNIFNKQKKEQLKIEREEERVKVKKKAVVIFSLEMSQDQLATRSLQAAKIDDDKLNKCTLTEADFIRLTKVLGEYAELPIFIQDEANLSIEKLRIIARKLKREVSAGLLIIDYLQLMEAKAESRVQEISKISRGLKLLAKELDIPIIALSQLSRALEQRQNKRPILSDLRDSGTIEQDADTVLFLYRPEYYKSNDDSSEFVQSGSDDFEGKTEVIIAKQRNGPLGTVDLRFLPKQQKFNSIEYVHKPG
ncbi:MAG: replicative DNA helicase [Flavobacteriales bacterium]|nr:replicative DNA helicase [Flavobacteriales bacterium]